ncbi:MAG: hypothetical protein LBQ65_05885 [Tannerellaceae bacterium]|jgi:hypothetical protein|nr:hypothetical protein [Tannerellaceae bacterium]
MEEKKKQKKRKKKNKRLSFVYILGGGILKEGFFVRHIKMIVLVTILTLIFIGNRYACLMSIRTMDKLRKELHETKLESLAISVELAGFSRPSVVEEQVKRLQMDLESATTPPYELYK